MTEARSVIDLRAGVRRVAIIGTGAVGSAIAFALVQEGRAREVVLMDKDHRRAEGELMDLSHCLPYGRPVKLEVCALGEITGCDFVVVTAGVAQQPGESRTDLVKRNAEIYAELFPQLSDANPKAVFVIITNPVDIMTRLARKLSGLPPEQIFGSGTVLDTARFRLLLSHHFRIDPRSIHAYVIGEHGDSEVMVWSRGNIGPYTLQEFGEVNGYPLTDAIKVQIERDVRRAAYEIIERKGATNFAIGVSLLRIYESINYNQNRLQTVSRALQGIYGLEDLCMSLPSRIMRDGAQLPMKVPLNDAEYQALMRSADKLDEIYQQLKP